MRNFSLPLLAGLLIPALAVAGFKTSSHKGSDQTYDAASALDGNLETAWVVNPEDNNVGQYIEIDVPTSSVKGIDIVVGWAKTDEVWTDHARVKAGKIQVYTLDGGEPKLVHQQDVSFEDKKDVQTVRFDPKKVGGEFDGGRVRFTITEVYKGKDYDHLAMSEFLVHLEEFDVVSYTLDGMPSSEMDDHMAIEIMDDSTRTYWAASEEGEASFSLDPGSYSVSSVGIYPGPSSMGRPKVVEISQGSSSRTYTLPNKAQWNWLEIPALMGFTGSGFGSVQVKVVETYPGSSSKNASIAEVKMKATYLEMF